jgi:hypothetical protein
MLSLVTNYVSTSMPCDLDKNIFGPFSLEMKLFSTKLYFTSIYSSWVWEKKERFVEKLQRRDKISQFRFGLIF